MAKAPIASASVEETLADATGKVCDEARVRLRRIGRGGRAGVGVRRAGGCGGQRVCLSVQLAESGANGCSCSFAWMRENDVVDCALDRVEYVAVLLMPGRDVREECSRAVEVLELPSSDQLAVDFRMLGNVDDHNHNAPL